MRLAIIPKDNAVYLNDVACIDLDLSQCGIPSNVHALQWYETKGWIEFINNGDDPFEIKPENQQIFELPLWAMNCCNLWKEPTPMEPLV